MKAMILSIALIFLLPVPASSQDILQVRLRWNSVSTTDLRTNESRTYASAFISGPGEIQWIQKNGQHVKTYSIRQQEGSWGDIARPGSILFHVTEGDSRGTIVFRRTATGVSVTLDFSALGPAAIKREFAIAEIQPVN